MAKIIILFCTVVFALVMFGLEFWLKSMPPSFVEGAAFGMALTVGLLMLAKAGGAEL